MDPFSSAALGAAFGELFVAIKNITNFMINNKSSCEEFKKIIVGLKPKIDYISEKEPEWKSLQSLLQHGLDLVNKLEKLGSLNLYRKYSYGKKILKLEKSILDFMITRGIANMMLDVQKLDMDFRQRFDRLEEMGKDIMDSVNRMTNNAESNSLMLQKMSAHQNASGSGAQVPDLPYFVVGLNNIISDVKRILFQDDVDIVGIKGIGGSGKSTLALALCKDTQVKDYFQNNIIFITVSREPDVKAVLETMWDKLIGGKRPGFQNIEDARRQLQISLNTSLNLRPKPTLIVLDDVWSRLSLEDLLFEAEGYKTIITTRHNFTLPSNSRLYELPMLRGDDALSLFCFWAFGQPSLPETTDENFVEVVKEVERECKGLPLALKVIGSSLCGEPYPVWESAKQKLSRGEPISQYHKEGLFNRLETSIDVLDDELKQCFLDMGAFPEGRKFRVNVLLDIWVYVHGIEWKDAFVVLLELTKRNLLNLTSSPRGRSISYGFAYELSFSQHDVMRDLALHLANQDSTGNSKRLFMPKKDGIPRKWLDQSFNARIVSIHTGAMDQKQWGQIDFPEAEALILFFDASVYYLPPFLQRMPKLKVQLICNYNSKCTVVDGLENIHSLTQIKSVYLERLIVPPLYNSWKSLEKLSICLCEGLGNMIGLDKDKGLNFPQLVEMNLDHCSDLEVLPSEICDLTSLQRLCVTNCHLVYKLPDDLGRLRLLKLLMLSACPNLGMLPVSICKLGQLEFLDISSCRCLKDLPMEFDKLSNLNTLDMRECSGLRQLPKALGKLRSLRHVICDEKLEKHWQPIKTYAMPELKLEVAEESFNLDWLDD